MRVLEFTMQPDPHGKGGKGARAAFDAVRASIPDARFHERDYGFGASIITPHAVYVLAQVSAEGNVWCARDMDAAMRRIVADYQGAPP